LLDALPDGGALSFSAWVRADADANVDASLLISESGLEPREFNIATTRVASGSWREISGYLGLGYEAAPSSLALKIHGPAANMGLCVMNVRLEPLSVE
jgi:hypothetical protein